jgi:hypothetical protein
MLSLILALAFAPSPCPMTIGIGADGALYSDRMHGWYRITLKSFENDLQTGCYNDSNPSSVTSVKVLLAAGAKKSKVDLVFTTLKRDGWERKQADVQSWSEYPNPPHQRIIAELFDYFSHRVPKALRAFQACHSSAVISQTSEGNRPETKSRSSTETTRMPCRFEIRLDDVLSTALATRSSGKARASNQKSLTHTQASLMNPWPCQGKPSQNPRWVPSPCLRLMDPMI